MNGRCLEIYFKLRKNANEKEPVSSRNGGEETILKRIEAVLT